MEPSGKGSGAPRGQNLPGGRQGCAGERRGSAADGALTFCFEPDLEERQALKEKQKMCRSRAQKYLIETNRRRRAFEERRKQEEEKERRLREQILQQRKIKLQEATDKFQRAQTPFSRNKQIVQTKADFQLEEALEQIKGLVLTPGLCLPSQNKTNFRTTDDTSSSSASRNGSFHQKQISAMVGWDKRTQESSRTSVDGSQLLFQKNLKEIRQLYEKKHLSHLEFMPDTGISPQGSMAHQLGNKALNQTPRTQEDRNKQRIAGIEETERSEYPVCGQAGFRFHALGYKNFHQEVQKTDDSESLSSLDSLEAGEQNGNYTTPSESSLTTQCDCALYNPEKSQTQNNGLFYTEQSTSKNMHLNNCPRNADLQNNHNLPVHDLLAKHNVLVPAEHVNNSEEESSASHRSGKKPAEFSTNDKQESSVSNAFRFLQNIKERSKPPSGTAVISATGHPAFSLSKACASPDSIPGERVQDLMQDQSFKMTPQKRTLSVQSSSQPIATSIILFPNQGCSTGIPSTADTLPKDKNISTEFLKNTSGKMTETKKEKCIDDINPGSSLIQDIPNASVLCDVKQQNNKEEEKVETMVETMSLVSDMELNSDTPAQHKTLENNILERKRARLFTSILKKKSKYEPSHFKAVVINHGSSFGRRPISSVRDSLELAKMRKKIAENEKHDRKLRWCDQIDWIIVENNEKYFGKNTSEISSAQLQYVQTTNNAPKTNLNIVAQPSNPTFIKNHQENSHISKPNVNTEESNKDCTSLNIFMSTGSFSAKKAWMVSKDEESKLPVCRNNSKTNEVNKLKNKTQITRRPRSVKAQPSFMPKNRRGPIIPPQPNAEANKTLKAPGKWLGPHPPSAPLLGNRSGESPGCQPLPPSSLQATTASRNDLNERHVLLADQVFNRNGTENSESITCHSVFATAVPTPGWSMAKYEPWAKNTCSVNSVQGSASQAHSVACTERRHGYTQHTLCLHHTPTAGKTSTLWQAAHAARAPKDSATGVVPVTRQKQIFDNRENEHLSAHRRQIVASERWKPTHHTQNSLCAVQLGPIQSAFNPVQSMNYTRKSDEVSESTVQFLMAEKLASTPLAEDEILAAVENVQTAKQPLLLSRAPCLGMSALSIEEQKIFQSLDHLNQRLQNVLEATTRNTPASNVLQIFPPLSTQQCVSSPLVNTTIASRQYQNASASNQLQLYRRY